MRHVTLGWPNHLREAALSGGAWSAALPLDHLGSLPTARFAESADAALASTKWTMTFPRPRPIGVVALAKHNLTVDAKWRVRVYFDTSGTELAIDSGWVAVWPAVFATLELEWEYDNYWAGTLDEDDRASFTPLATRFLDAVQIGRRVDIEIDDQNNPDGVIRVGLGLVTDLWQPTYNAAYGIQYGYDIATEFETASNPDQTEYADPMTPKRTVSFALEHLTEEEGFRRMLSLQRTQGLHGEILYAESLETSTIEFARTFIARQTSVDPLSHPYFETYSNSINLKEIL